MLIFQRNHPFPKKFGKFRWHMLIFQRNHPFPKKFGKFRWHLKYERKKYGILIFLVFDFYSDEIIIKS